MIRLIFHQADIDGIIQDQLLDGGGVLDDCFDPQLGEGELTAMDEGGQNMSTDRDAGPNAKNAFRVPIPEFPFHLRKEGDDVEGIAVEFLSAFRGDDPPAGSREEAGAVVIFQFPYGQADGWLGQMQRLGSLCDAVMLKDGDIYVQMAEGHGSSFLKTDRKKRGRREKRIASSDNFIIKKLYIL